jgi:hypothetical protein
MPVYYTAAADINYFGALFSNEFITCPLVKIYDFKRIHCKEPQ